MVKRSWHSILLVMFSILIGLALAEVLLRVFGLGYGHQPHVSHAVLHHANPSHYTYRAYDPRGEFGGHSVRFDGDGLRVVTGTANTNSLTVRKTGWVLGDSFVLAREVSDEDIFVSQLNRLQDDYTFRNLGVMSYAPTLSYLQMQTLLARGARMPEIVLHLLYSNDSIDDDVYANQAQTSLNGALKAVPGPGDGWKQKMRGLYTARLLRRVQIILKAMISGSSSPLDNKGVLIERDTAPLSDLTKTYIGKVKALSEGIGAQYVLMCVPSKVEYNFKTPVPNKFCDQVKAWAFDQAVRFHDLDGYFKQNAKHKPFLDVDIHLNTYGHALVAQSLAAFLKKP